MPSSSGVAVAGGVSNNAASGTAPSPPTSPCVAKAITRYCDRSVALTRVSVASSPSRSSFCVGCSAEPMARNSFAASGNEGNARSAAGSARPPRSNRTLRVPAIANAIAGMGARVGAPMPAKLRLCAPPLPTALVDGVSMEATSILCWRISQGARAKSFAASVAPRGGAVSNIPSGNRDNAPPPYRLRSA